MKNENILPNILIVDDVVENVDVLDAILKPFYRRSAALRGKRALEIANSEFPPDLILLDVMLPDIDGYEVCRKLKASEKTKRIPVIFVTAKDEVNDETKGFELGGVDYVTKPISPPVVLARVKTHLDLYNTHKELERQHVALKEAARLRENVARMVHHDMKSPLQGIINYPEFLSSDENLNDSQRQILEEIKGCGYKILHMINISLDMVKMEMGIYKIQPTSVEILRVIKKVLGELGHMVSAADRSVSILVDERPVTQEDKFIVLGEEFLCYSMLSNLIKNALEASPERGHVAINLEADNTAKINIHNDGAIPEPIRKTFFEKYVTCGKKDGTGLGTYSAKLMAKTQKGGIELETSEEHGTTVIVTLPVGQKTHKLESKFCL